MLASLFVDRGVRIDHTYQLNFGGNTDFMNMLERERLESKKKSKTGAVTSMIPYELASEDIHVGPSDYVPWLKDRKFCHIRMEGTTFGDVPLLLEASWKSGIPPTRPVWSSMPALRQARPRSRHRRSTLCACFVFHEDPSPPV
jgi:myo-inositol-1-phosphate synthase